MSKLALRSSLVRGTVNLPGITFESKALTKKLLERDYVDHHCYFRTNGFHNHLNHHLLAAYDLGAPPALLQAIYDAEASSQRPLDGEGTLKDLVIDHKNWTEYVGKPDAYKAFLEFFSQEIQDRGMTDTFEKYVFDPSANGNGTEMLARFSSGAYHPLIQCGYGFEFQDALIVAEGLAQAAIHPASAAPVLQEPLCPPVSPNSNQVHNGTRQPAYGKSVLSILRAVYDSDKLIPVMPYDPDALLSKRMRDFLSVPRAERPAEIVRLCSEWSAPLPSSSEPAALAAFEADLAGKVEECMWLATLLTFATGKKGRKTRLDFFMMHTLTSSLFLAPTLAALKTPEYKVAYLQCWLRGAIMFVILRGRPRIDPELLMSYTAFPQPSRGSQSAQASKDAVGQPGKADQKNPWMQLLASVLYTPDSHTIKVMRSLVAAEQQYGTTPPGGVIGAFEEDGKTETHAGAAKLDGSVFVRAAGVLMDTLGWVDYGQKEGDWDRSALGWDDAWKNDD
ncbi:hypothetical protein DACRYDRAFT_20805 [Dacryopinax primogenitus]|uniref:Oxidoreductase AflY n=1 Tax=Dacryopinax primogenitus (strain DJM 731) TaxID=1858805 RepID=M5G1Y5_DACPD|nr:uncharacterized protein DACRYDRAFT_20805 [Dacryopinax primogenitus]EJU04191.1 hypothetical protein DACRYDRAFT_20805 [Dacryopinax primogenitus]